MLTVAIGIGCAVGGFAAGVWFGRDTSAVAAKLARLREIVQEEAGMDAWGRIAARVLKEWSR